MAGSNVGDPPLRRAELREEFVQFRGELFRQCAPKADVAELRAWLVGVSVVVVLNVFGTARYVLATMLTR
jgi:hypothetical protein